MDNEYLTVKEASEFLGVSKAVIYSKINRGLIKHVKKDGWHILITEAEVLRLIDD